MGRGPTTEYHKEMMDGYSKGTITCLASHYIKENANIDFPLVLNIEPTNACNLKCYLCPRDKGARKVGYMDFELFKKIIDEGKSYKKLKMINFHKDGEPLLHPDILKMISYAGKNNAAEVLHLNTNGLALDERFIGAFLDCGINDVTVSVDAARGSTFKKIKGADLLDKVEKNLKMLFEAKKRMLLKKPFVRVKIMEFEEVEKGEVEEFICKWRDMADDVQVTGVHSWSGAIENLRVTDEVKNRRYPCILLWYMMAVNWDGIVSACNVDWDLTAAIGNINKESLHQIWNGKKLKALRMAELRGDHNTANVCNECVVWAGGEDMTDWFRKHEEFYQ